jgi:hypothetical protein
MLNVTKLFNKTLSAAFAFIGGIVSGIFHGLWQPEANPSYLSGRYVMIPIAEAKTYK